MGPLGAAKQPKPPPGGAGGAGRAPAAGCRVPGQVGCLRGSLEGGPDPRQGNRSRRQGLSRRVGPVPGPWEAAGAAGRGARGYRGAREVSGSARRYQRHGERRTAVPEVPGCLRGRAEEERRGNGGGGGSARRNRAVPGGYRGVLRGPGGRSPGRGGAVPARPPPHLERRFAAGGAGRGGRRQERRRRRRRTGHAGAALRAMPAPLHPHPHPPPVPAGGHRARRPPGPAVRPPGAAPRAAPGTR